MLYKTLFVEYWPRWNGIFQVALKQSRNVSTCISHRLTSTGSAALHMLPSSLLTLKSNTLCITESKTGSKKKWQQLSLSICGLKSSTDMLKRIHMNTSWHSMSSTCCQSGIQGQEDKPAGGIPVVQPHFDCEHNELFPPWLCNSYNQLLEHLWWPSQ